MVLDEWLADIPEQYQGKEKITALLEAFSKQMEEIKQVFSDVNDLTNIDTAEGQSLDNVGSILSMSRADANVILRKGYDDAMTDNIYRQCLKWKAIKNTSDCTYADIMKSLKELWGAADIKYSEPVNKPATIAIDMPTIPIDGYDPVINRILSIKPAGVQVIYFPVYKIDVPIEEYEAGECALERSTTTWNGVYYFNGEINWDGGNVREVL